jgi:hypothetical protein
MKHSLFADVASSTYVHNEEDLDDTADVQTDIV